MQMHDSRPQAMARNASLAYWTYLITRTEQQVGRDLWRLPCQSPCSKQRQLEEIAQDLSSWVWSIAKDGDSSTSLDNPVPVFNHLYSKKAFFVCLFKWNCLSFSLCPLPLLLSLGSTEESGSVCFTLSPLNLVLSLLKG